MGIKEDLKIPLTMLSISFLNKSPFKGSYKGIRFMFEKNGDKLKVYKWEDKFCFEKIDKKDISEAEFDFTKDGIEEGLKWLSV